MEQNCSDQGKSGALAVISSEIPRDSERLAIAWRVYASNRPEFERQCSLHNERMLTSLKGHPVPMTGALTEYFARDAQIRTEEVVRASEIDRLACERVNEIAEAIQAKQCEDLNDLAALANACAVAAHEWWETPAKDLDWEFSMARKLVEEVLRVARVAIVLDGLPLPQQIDQDALQRASEAA